MSYEKTRKPELEPVTPTLGVCPTCRTTHPTKHLLTTREVAGFLGVRVSTVRTWLSRQRHGKPGTPPSFPPPLVGRSYPVWGACAMSAFLYGTKLATAA